MLHLKDKVNNENDICELNTINNLAEMLKSTKSKVGFVKEITKDNNYDELLKESYIFNDGAVSDKCVIKLIDNSEINEYIIESSEFDGIFIDSEDLKIDKSSDYLFLYDDEMSLMMPAVKVKNDSLEYYKIYVDKFIYIREYLLDKCDGCSCTSLKELLFNLYPEINTGLNERYADFKGCICSECLTKMEQGLNIKNQQCDEEAQTAGDVMEKIDEFSSIEDILKFCGMENRDELEKALKNKIK
ncbi:hypothetical protein [uncultured Clostridium sp.]|uniref:hypothetical protein n=1 Tax=uncultured Clostridium sp. TaxID=59620 RepID=UPI0025DC584D|nr:hypothetical protein [uncultured Clostridium sp.]